MTVLVQHLSTVRPLSESPTPGPDGTAVDPFIAQALQQKQADENWARWLDKGIRHDRAMRRRFQIAASILVLGGVFWLALALVGS